MAHLVARPAAEPSWHLFRRVCQGTEANQWEAKNKSVQGSR